MSFHSAFTQEFQKQAVNSTYWNWLMRTSPEARKHYALIRHLGQKNIEKARQAGATIQALPADKYRLGPHSFYREGTISLAPKNYHAHSDHSKKFGQEVNSKQRELENKIIASHEGLEYQGSKRILPHGEEEFNRSHFDEIMKNRPLIRYGKDGLDRVGGHVDWGPLLMERMAFHTVKDRALLGTIYAPRLLDRNTYEYPALESLLKSIGMPFKQQDQKRWLNKNNFQKAFEERYNAINAIDSELRAEYARQYFHQMPGVRF